VNETQGWIPIDIWPKGRAGFDARYRLEDDRLFVYVEGTNHFLDWPHHVMPFSGRREREAAYMIRKRLIDHIPGRAVHLAGFSLGGAVAVELARLIAGKKSLLILGSKRPRWRARLKHMKYRAIRTRGDWVPCLPPWRPRIRRQEKIGRWTPLFWRAHLSPEYKEILRREGF
jgi:pimeloyl-ACP methyl ester carboxylesterase